MGGPTGPNSKWQTMFARTNRSENPIVKSRRDAHAHDERQVFFSGQDCQLFSLCCKPQGKVGDNKSFWGKMESMFDLDREQIFARIVAILGVSSSQHFCPEIYATSTFPVGSVVNWVFTFPHNNWEKFGDKKTVWSIVGEGKVEKCLPSFSINQKRVSFQWGTFPQTAGRVHNGLECGRSEREKEGFIFLTVWSTAPWSNCLLTL